jgi:hypothetical protein
MSAILPVFPVSVCIYKKQKQRRVNVTFFSFLAAWSLFSTGETELTSRGTDKNAARVSVQRIGVPEVGHR